MVALIVVTCVSLYLVGLRADRIHAGRAVMEPGDGQVVSAGNDAIGSDGLTRDQPETSPGSVTVPLYKNHSAGYWNWRYRQTSRELRSVRRSLHFTIHEPVYGKTTIENAFLCIHGYEGSWWDSGAPFWGGLQMDSTFQSTYAPWAVSAFGTADHWPISVQIATAIRAYVSGRGFYPWPNTARACGLI